MRFMLLFLASLSLNLHAYATTYFCSKTDHAIDDLTLSNVRIVVSEGTAIFICPKGPETFDKVKWLRSEGKFSKSLSTRLNKVVFKGFAEVAALFDLLDGELVLSKTLVNRGAGGARFITYGDSEDNGEHVFNYSCQKGESLLDPEKAQ